MGRNDKLLERIRKSPHDVPFDDVVKLCEEHFGEPRQRGGSHVIFKTPWPGDPRVNVQKGKNGKAKDYQVRQVIDAIDKLKRDGKTPDEDGNEDDKG
ncbi:MAG: toxin HicA [Acidimicrobiales bacterium]